MPGYILFGVGPSQTALSSLPESRRPPCGMLRAGLGRLVVFLRGDELELPYEAVHDDIVARDAEAAFDERGPGPFLLPSH